MNKTQYRLKSFSLKRPKFALIDGVFFDGRIFEIMNWGFLVEMRSNEHGAYFVTVFSGPCIRCVEGVGESAVDYGNVKFIIGSMVWLKSSLS